MAHTASDLSFRPDPHGPCHSIKRHLKRHTYCLIEVITPVVQGVCSILKSAAATPTVKRFVYTSSSAAASRPKPNTKFHIDQTTWNEDDVAKAWEPPPYTDDRSWAVYGASKTQAEKECWRFVKEERPGFVLNTVLPNFVTGEILSSKQAGSTAGWVNGMDAEHLNLQNIFKKWLWTEMALQGLITGTKNTLIG